MQGLLEFAKKYPEIDDIKLKLAEFERFLSARIEQKEQMTYTGDDEIEEGKNEEKRNSRLKTNVSKRTQGNVSMHNDPISTEIAVPLMPD